MAIVPTRRPSIVQSSRTLLEHALLFGDTYTGVLDLDLPVLTAGQSYSLYATVTTGKWSLLVSQARQVEIIQSTSVQLRSRVYIYFADSDRKGANPQRFTTTGGFSIPYKTKNGYYINNVHAFTHLANHATATTYGPPDHQVGMILITVDTSGNKTITSVSGQQDNDFVLIPPLSSVFFDVKTDCLSGATVTDGVRIVSTVIGVEGVAENIKD